MIYERLLATEADKQRLDTTLFVRERLSALEEDVAVDELYKEEILSGVPFDSLYRRQVGWPGAEAS